MKQLSTLISDELMEGLDVLVAADPTRDRSYFVRQAISEYLHKELPKVPQRKKDQGDLKDLLRMAQQNAPPKK